MLGTYSPSTAEDRSADLSILPPPMRKLTSMAM
jgi:hypothetical protein